MPGGGGAKPGRELMAEAAHHLGHGLTLAASTAAFLFAGWVADGWLGTKPLLTIIGALVGAGAGFYHLYRRLVVVERERSKRRREGPEE